jgi:hypothetical protein
MWLLLLEALMALLVFVFIVWWTMFAGRDPGANSGQGEHGQNDGHDSNKH